MMGLLFSVAREVAKPTLRRIFAETVVRAAAHAAGAAAVGGVAYAVKNAVQNDRRNGRQANGVPPKRYTV